MITTHLKKKNPQFECHTTDHINWVMTGSFIIGDFKTQILYGLAQVYTNRKVMVTSSSCVHSCCTVL